MRPSAFMSETVGIRFPNSGKTYCFKSEGVEVRRGDRVVVESELGISIGQVVKLDFATEIPLEEMRSVLRKVTQVDLQQEEENEAVKREAREYGMQRIEERKLPMKLMDTEVTLDRKRFIFYFVADGRIDFRELVKDLASKFRTRIELRQIGVRDAAKIVGGYGICGQEFCCKTFLKSFAPISIKMAKQQDLVLNTCKLSGQCGRLMCCLNYEYDPNEGGRRRRPQPAEEMEPQDSAEELEALEDKEQPIVARQGSAEDLEPWDRPEVIEQNRQIAEAAAAAFAKPAERSFQQPQQPQQRRQPSPEHPPQQDGARRGRRRKKRGGGARPPASEGARSSAPEGARPQGTQPQSSGAQPQQQRADAGPREGTGAPREGTGTPGGDAKKKSRRRRWKPHKKKEGGGAPQQ